jgi:hypothetical protein
VKNYELCNLVAITKTLENDQFYIGDIFTFRALIQFFFKCTIFEIGIQIFNFLGKIHPRVLQKIAKSHGHPQKKP